LTVAPETLVISRALAAAVLVFSFAAVAQEIGKELPPEKAKTPPPSTAPTSYDNPYAPPPTAPPEPEAPKAPERTVPGPHKGAYGIRAGFGGASFGLPVTGGTGAAAVSVISPTVGFKYFATDDAGILFDVGTALLLVQGNALFGFGFGFGVDYHLGSAAKPIRPFVTGGVSLSGAGASRGFGLALGFNVGGGGEYWFSDYFSVNARALLALPMSLEPFVLGVATVSPGLGATLYF
jgi:hypothetical protein